MLEPSAFAASAAPKDRATDRARPTSITVIAWLVAISTVVASITSCAILSRISATDPNLAQLLNEGLLPLPAQYALMLAGLVVGLVSASGWLAGLNWSRWLYVVWSGLGAAVGFATSPRRLLLIPELVCVGAVLFVLFRPAANAYFTRGGAR